MVSKLFLWNRFLKKFMKFFCRKFFRAAKSFPQKPVPNKKFYQNFFGKFFLVAKSFPRKQVLTKNFHQNIFGLKIFYGCKIISSNTGSYNKFLSTNVWSKNFYGCKIISSKPGSYQKLSLKIIWSKIFFMVAK